MKVLITGSSNGIGRAAAMLFLFRGFDVVGLDKEKSTIRLPRYKHYVCDVSDKSQLPHIEGINILFVNAGSQNTEDDIKNNLYSAIYTVEKYSDQPTMKSILFNASVSAHNGAEFPFYICSKGGMLPYMKYVAAKYASNNVTVNSISCGGVSTKLNEPVMNDKETWSSIMNVTPMKKWATPEEIAEWVYFLTVYNRSCTGQDIVIDNGEYTIGTTGNFQWPNS